MPRYKDGQETVNVSGVKRVAFVWKGEGVDTCVHRAGKRGLSPSHEQGRQLWEEHLKKWFENRTQLEIGDYSHQRTENISIQDCHLGCCRKEVVRFTARNSEGSYGLCICKLSAEY